MNIAEIKGRLTNMPHVTCIWVKGTEFFIHPVSGGTKVNLLDDTETPIEIPAEIHTTETQEKEENKTQEITKPRKKQKNGTK